ncbi:Uncharacterized protein YjbI, contains pentapeptide repeats [Desulfonatronum zhilinae]|nr:Uncharacterized protein YjbI, contains pentapeptide repeats [Desulfonatronum zhilinae]
MKVVKPDTLSLLYAAHPRPSNQPRADGDFSLVLGAMACFSFADHELLREDVLWRHVQQSLPEGEALDFGLPKPRAEYLVYGACCSRNPVRGKEVLVQVGGLQKRLHVFGPRFWRSHGPTAPRPFTRIPMDWRHAYGGPEYPDNPQGLGHGRLKQGVHPLPLVEAPGHFVAFPRQKTPPAGLTAIPAQWPARQRHLGTVDGAWLERDWPGPPSDQNPEYACTAPPDQRFPGFLRGGEPFLIKGMHPGKEVLHGRLPELRARIFLLRRPQDSGKFIEAPSRLETVWLFPETETGVVLFRAVAGTRDEECADIAAVMVVLEGLDQEPLPTEEYKEQCLAALIPGGKLRTELDVPNPAPEPSASAPLVAAGVVGATGLGPAAASANAGESSLQSLVAVLEQEVSGYLDSIGVSRDQVETLLAEKAAESGEIEAGTVPDDLLQGLQETARAVEAETAALLSRHGLDPEMAQRMLSDAATTAQGSEDDCLAGLHALMARDDLPPEVRQGVGSALSGFQEVQAALGVLAAKLGAPSGKRAETPSVAEKTGPDDLGRLTTEQALERHVSGQGLAGCDLSGCDFAGHDLAGADLRRAILDGAAWPGVILTGADLTGAMARKADLTGADLSRARLNGAVFEQARLTRANLRECLARRARFQGADLSGADLSQADLHGADCTQANLRKARMDSLHGRDLRLNGADLREVECSGAALPGSRADLETDGTGAVFRDADLKDARWSGAILARTDFSRADLDGADLCKADLSEADLYQATARRARLIKAILHRARLVGVNLFQASLRFADCTGARMEDLNLFGADLYRCVLDPPTLQALRSRSDVNLDRTPLRPGILEQTA